MISFLNFIKEGSERSLNRLINNNNLDLNIYSEEIINTNIDLFKTEINTKEQSFLKNNNKLNFVWILKNYIKKLLKLLI